MNLKDIIYEPEDERSNSINWQPESTQSQSRAAAHFRPNSVAQYLSHQQKRFFFSVLLNPFSLIANTNNGPFWRVSSTLVTVTAQSTLLAAVIQTCIPSAQFTRNQTIGSCDRKKRHIIEINERLGNVSDVNNSSEIHPTPVQRCVL